MQRLHGTQQRDEWARRGWRGGQGLVKHFDFCHKRNSNPVKGFKEPYENQVNSALNVPRMLTEAINANIISEVVKCYGIRDLN